MIEGVQVPVYSQERLESLAQVMALEQFKLISPNPEKLVQAAPSLLQGNRGKDYVYLTRLGEGLGSLVGKTFTFWDQCGKVGKGKFGTVLAVDESGLTVGKKGELEALRDGVGLIPWRRKGVKARSVDLVHPVRCSLMLQFADLRGESPSLFLLHSVQEVVKHVEVDYVLADAGFLNFQVLREMPVKTMVRGKSGLKGFQQLSSLRLQESVRKVEDRTYVAYRELELDGLYYYDVVYVKDKERPRHFTFVTNFKGDPYTLAELYRLRWQIEEGFKIKKARIELVRKLRNKVFLFLYYTILDNAWNLFNRVVFGYVTPGKKFISFDSFIKLL
ncbi:transposase [Metallosphaera hakonensis]|uniref:ISH3 family transposase n=1 Tax=Metallosphaera hakonensis JCM 8857 = DSM 7519 TaxID=1293036 RepID=A0A2U9IXI2_9CREN|nr:transposase [Metallosphaera hakonensis]AWS00489.1 transposase [Metallosphaera hakonensis JCM 8857 = DSM 7519]AWS00713.1 transposase [Metallosphaera hakonensis JCM 8857 = DSM 7519]